MPLGKTLHEMVYLYVVAANDISAKVSNYDDKLFDTNDFFDLNQVPNPDMGLNLQARRA